ncbi:MAG: class I SAM-dependent methyltransferase [Pseudomonadota bacterium]
MAPFPNGHFYSPIVDPGVLEARRRKIWPASPPEIAGVDFCENEQRLFLEKIFPEYLDNFNYPEDEKDKKELYDYCIANGQFSGLDACALFVMLLKFHPRRMIEVGSGFSSLLTADVNRNFLDGKLNFTCIEPYPRDFLVPGVPGISSLIQTKVEDVGLDLFAELGSNDILFIDSSHVCKTGSDVNYLYFEVLPRLNPGVIIHIHDIFFPYDYPPKWVIDENRSWNEQYLLRALLMHSRAFKVLFGCAYAHYVLPDLVRSVCGGQLLGGGSFWMKRV